MDIQYFYYKDAHLSSSIVILKLYMNELYEYVLIQFDVFTPLSVSSSVAPPGYLFPLLHGLLFQYITCVCALQGDWLFMTILNYCCYSYFIKRKAVSSHRLEAQSTAWDDGEVYSKIPRDMSMPEHTYSPFILPMCMLIPEGRRQISGNINRRVEL